MGLLEKRKSEITPAERKFLEKKFGVPGMDYPMLGRREVRDAQGGVNIETFIGRLSNAKAPMVVTSERPKHEVVCMMHRMMPIPSMLPIQREIWRRMEIDSNNRVFMSKGRPGVGKTFLAEGSAHIASERPPIKVDCGDRNLNEMFFETVLDLNANKKLLKTVNTLLASGQVEDHTLHILRENLSSAFHEEGGKYAIDWAAIHAGDVFEQERDSEKESAERRVEKSEITRRVEQALTMFAKYEGLSDKANPLGMTTQEGEIIRGRRLGLIVIEDEYNRGKKDTHAASHGYLQFETGDDVDHVTVQSKLKEKGEETNNTFTFHHADDTVGFMLFMTGNTEEDGSDVKTLPESLNDRIVPETVPEAQVYDWQHRWCQFLTQIPVSTEYAAFKREANENPDAFRSWLKFLRVGDLTDEQRLRDAKRIDLQMRLLDRWENVNEATANLADWCYGMTQLINPESDMLRKTTSLGELLGEVDARFKKEVAFGFRKIKYFLNKAMKAEAEVLDPEDCDDFDFEAFRASIFDEAQDHAAGAAEEDPLLKLGTRLSQVIQEFIEVHIREAGKPKLYEHARKLAVDCGIIAPQLNEARRSQKRTLAELLDLNPFLTSHAGLRASLVRDLVCDHLRTKYGDLSAENDEVLATGEVALALKDIEAIAADPPDTGPLANVFGAINTDLDGNVYQPFRIFRTLDTTPRKDGETPTAPRPDNLVSLEDFVLALGVPATKSFNLSACWNRALSASAAVAEGTHTDKALTMAEGRADSGFAITTVLLSHEGRPSPLHIVRNGKTDKTLLVGEAALTEPQRRYLENGGIAYINRREGSALRQIKTALRTAIGVGDDALAGDLKAAFLYRSGFMSRDRENEASLAELLASTETNAYFGHYMTKTPYREMARHG